MTGTDPEQIARRRHWAAEQLGLSPDVSPELARAAILRQLPKDDFVPPTEPGADFWQDRVEEKIAQAEEKNLRQDVDDFTNRFWNFSPPYRRAIWHDLLVRTESVASLRAWLRHLEKGLDLDGAPVSEKTSEKFGVLNDLIRELFILRPPARSQERQQFLNDIAAQRSAWRIPAKQFRKNSQSLAALEPDLLNELASSRKLRLTPKPPAVGEASDRAASQRPLVIVLLFFVGVFIKTISGTSTPRPNQPPAPHVSPFTLDNLPTLKNGEFYGPDGRRIPPDQIGEATKRLLGYKPSKDNSVAKDQKTPSGKSGAKPKQKKNRDSKPKSSGP